MLVNFTLISLICVRTASFIGYILWTSVINTHGNSFARDKSSMKQMTEAMSKAFWGSFRHFSHFIKVRTNTTAVAYRNWLSNQSLNIHSTCPQYRLNLRFMTREVRTRDRRSPTEIVVGLVIDWTYILKTFIYPHKSIITLLIVTINPTYYN